MEEIQNPIVHASFTNPELMNAMPEQVRQRPSQFVAGRGQALDRSHAGFICFLIRFAKFAEPIENWHLSFWFPVEDDVRARHRPTSTRLSQYCDQIADPHRFGQIRDKTGDPLRQTQIKHQARLRNIAQALRDAPHSETDSAWQRHGVRNGNTDHSETRPNVSRCQNRGSDLEGGIAHGRPGTLGLLPLKRQESVSHKGRSPRPIPRYNPGSG